MLFRSAQEKAVVKSAIDDFNSFTCLEFVERTNEADYINIVKDGGCWSEVGRSGGKQDLSLSDDCVYVSIIFESLSYTSGKTSQTTGLCKKVGVVFSLIR